MILPLVKATKSTLNDMQRAPSAWLAKFLNLIDNKNLKMMAELTFSTGIFP